MKKKLQEIIEGCKHPKARAFFETLFARHDEIMESLTGRANDNIVDEIAGQYENVVDFNEALQGVQWDDDDEDEEFDFIAGQSCEEVIKQLDELGPDVLDRYKDRASAKTWHLGEQVHEACGSSQEAGEQIARREASIKPIEHLQ